MDIQSLYNKAPAGRKAFFVRCAEVNPKDINRNFIFKGLFFLFFYFWYSYLMYVYYLPLYGYMYAGLFEMIVFFSCIFVIRGRGLTFKTQYVRISENSITIIENGVPSVIPFSDMESFYLFVDIGEKDNPLEINIFFRSKIKLLVEYLGGTSPLVDKVKRGQKIDKHQLFLDSYLKYRKTNIIYDYLQYILMDHNRQGIVFNLKKSPERLIVREVMFESMYEMVDLQYLMKLFQKGPHSIFEFRRYGSSWYRSYRMRIDYSKEVWEKIEREWSEKGI